MPDIQQIVFDALEELMAFRQNIKIEQGATFRCIVTCKDADGAVVPLTGCTARAHLRYAYTDTNPAGVFTCTVDEALGTVTCELSAVTTAALTKTSGVWDCEMVYAGGTVQRLVEGRVTISPEATK
jgi:hypothetical protein